MRKTEIWEFILKQINENISTVLITVSDSVGFTPGKIGFKLALASNGIFKGTIGGGNLEYEMIEKGKQLLKDNQTLPVKIIYSLQHKLNDENNGMICGGKQEILFVFFNINHISHIENIITTIQSKIKAKIEIDESGTIKTNKASIQKTSKPDNIIYTETVGYEPTVHIIGGGHVSFALSHILSTLNYYIIVYDQREKNEILEKNIYADEKKQICFRTFIR